MENVILWVDDLRNPEEPQWKEYIKKTFKVDFPVVWVKSYKEFSDYIHQAIPFPMIISFDHDLGLNDDGIEQNGYDCAKLLVDMILDYKTHAIPTINVHSANPVGKDNIESLFKSLEKHIKEEEF